MQLTKISFVSSLQLKAWIRLIRLPNIIILASIFILLHVGIYLPTYAALNIATPLSGVLFVFFVFSVCLVAAGGNVINDYFDYKIDKINKPEKLIVEKEIGFEKAMNGYIVLTALGVIGGFITGWLIGIVKIGFFFGMGALLLYRYSEKYKRKLLVGNLIIALFGMLSILLLWIVEFFALRSHADSFVSVFPSLERINVLMGGYALFAFLTTFIREIIKDMEDMDGDQQYGCQTLPIAIGLPGARKVVAGLVAITFVLLIYCQLLCWANKLHLLALFIILLIQLPSTVLVFRLYKAGSKEDYHRLSTLLKWIMVAGILGIELVNFQV